MRYFFLSLLFLSHVACAQTAVLRGVVKNEKGVPLSGVLITLSTTAPYAGDISERDGTFYLPALTPGIHALDVKHKDYAPQLVSVEVKAGIEEQLQIVLLTQRAADSVLAARSRARGDSITYAASDIERAATRAPLDVVSKSSGTYSGRSGARVSIASGRASADVPTGEVVTHTTRRKEHTTTALKRAAPDKMVVEEAASMAYEHSSGDAPVAGVEYAPASPPPVPGSAVVVSPAARAGSLTSGESNDFSKWTLWEAAVWPTLEAYRQVWGLQPVRRYSVAVQSSTGTPVVGAKIRLMDGRKALWEARTDNTGRAELWAGFTDTTASTYSRLHAEITASGRSFRLDDLKPFGEGANNLRTDLSCSSPRTLDVAFIVDATGSMQDEINYLKAELTDILQRVRDSSPGLDVRTAALYYRDIGDEYTVLPQDFSPGIGKTVEFLSTNNAGGGGDRPEAVDMALDAGLNALSWRDDAATKLAFLVLDAPPHNDPTTKARLALMTAQYAARGIRLIPVACSGVEKSDEYLLRSLALATNGTYLFLTDHSGIGGGHIEPTTERYDVEYLNALVYRVIHQFSYVPECRAAVAPAQDPPAADTSVPVRWSFYPNPTDGLLTVEYEGLEGPFYVCDITGKALLQVPVSAPRGKTLVDLRQYPAGMYFLRYAYAPEKWTSGKVILQH